MSTKPALVTLGFLLAFCPVAVCYSASVDIGVSMDEGGLREFYFAIGNYYRVPDREVVLIAGRHIPDEEIPVVLFLARRVRVAPAVIVDLRLNGMSWMDITVHYGLTPEIFYVPVKVGPPYGKAYGHYMGKPKKEWKRVVLRDDDVVNLVNLKFVSEHYRYPAAEVVKLREGGRGFVVMQEDIKKAKKEKKEHTSGKGHKEKGDQKGKGKKEKG